MGKTLIEGNYKINRKLLIPNKIIYITENWLLDKYFMHYISGNTGLGKAALSIYSEDREGVEFEGK